MTGHNVAFMKNLLIASSRQSCRMQGLFDVTSKFLLRITSRLAFRRGLRFAIDYSLHNVHLPQRNRCFESKGSSWLNVMRISILIHFKNLSNFTDNVVIKNFELYFYVTIRDLLKCCTNEYMSKLGYLSFMVVVRLVPAQISSRTPDHCLAAKFQLTYLF